MKEIKNEAQAKAWAQFHKAKQAKACVVPKRMNVKPELTYKPNPHLPGTKL